MGQKRFIAVGGDGTSFEVVDGIFGAKAPNGDPPTLGLLPLALALGQPGSEIQAPMALVILTGLASSTLLNMLVVPTLIARWG